ncbi:MAG: glycoside hydrolase family 3 C-terminal domain-containing protein [Bacteroidales bacterium]|nr:glycoside hydrolase family 3 C-terminal domain-containing protein [Bacteroidales bacterium]
MFVKIILFNIIISVTILSTAIAQQDTTEKFISVGNLRFRDFNRNGKLDIYEDYRRPIDARAQNLLSQMTVEEKLAQLRCPFEKKTALYPENKFSQEKAKQMYSNGLGEILRLSDGQNAFALRIEKTPSSGEIAVLANETQHFFINETRLGIPVLFLEEGLHGLVVKDGTMFPTTLGMSSSWNEELFTEVYQAEAREARAIGTHNILGPVLDLALDPRWGRTEETMGEDPYLVSRLGVSIVKALQGNSENPDLHHVASTLKHFGAHGQPEGGGNTGPVFISDRQLREVNFRPFKAAITEGKALGVMPNYNEISGIPTHANKWMLTDVLRNEWGFKGVVISDYTATQELYQVHHVAGNKVEAGTLALNAGVDLELVDDFTYSGIPEAIDKGLTSIENLNRAVLRVLDLKFRLGLFENPYIETNNTETVGSKEHRELALKAARQSMVLLKNDNQLLPLDRKKYKKIAIIGPNADECILGGYSQLPRNTISPLSAIREKYKDVEINYAKGCDLIWRRSSLRTTEKPEYVRNTKLIHDAVEVAKNADIIILMLGGNGQISREATSIFNQGDLANLELLGDQNELIDSLKMLNKPMAAFVFSGPPISFMHLNNSVPAIVQCWYLGQETGYAVAETIFGDNNPSGKLSISIPRSAGHLPAYYYHKPSSRIKGYNLDDASPLYPFGFGLSYTKYEYNNLRIAKSTISKDENVTVTVDVKNIGERTGDEIVQLYIRDEVSSITRPIKELKDFKRITLNPGETKTVSFIITPDKLKFYNIDMKEVVEPGDFEIMVGSSSVAFESVKLTVIANSKK